MPKRPGAITSAVGAQLEATVPIAAFELLPAGVAVVDLQGRVQWTSSALHRLTGRGPAELLGRSVADFVPPLDLPGGARWAEALADAHAAPVRGEAWYTRPDGSRAHLVSDLVVVRDGAGIARYGLLTVHDNTVSQAVEDALRAANDELDSIVANAPLAICVTSLEGVVQLWNPQAELMFGWSATEVIGRRAPFTSTDPASTADLTPSPDRPFPFRDIREADRHGRMLDLGLRTAVLHSRAGAPAGILFAFTDVSERKATESDLIASEHRFRALVQNISDTVSIVDAEGRITFTSGQTEPVLGHPASWWSGRSIFDICHPDDAHRCRTLLEDLAIHPGQQNTAELRLRHANGGWEHISVTAVNMLHDPDIGGIVMTSTNVTEARRASLLLASQARILELIARSAPLDETLLAISSMVTDLVGDGVVGLFLVEGDRLVPRGGRHLPANVLQHLGVRPVEGHHVDGEALRTGEPVVVVDTHTDPLVASMRDDLSTAGLRSTWSLPVIDLPERLLGTIAVFHPEPGAPDAHERATVAAAGQLLEIALERNEAESRLAHQVLHDDLTGLPNRTLVLDRLSHALARARQLKEEVAVLFMDLDRFKVVNDSLGHGAGDQLLVSFAERLRSIVRPDDTIARFGGDEFVVLSEHLSGKGVGKGAVFAIADRLEEALRQPFLLDDGTEVFLSASLGLAIGDGPDADVLLRNADAAMYRAKELGRDRLEVFDEEMQEAAVARLNLGNDLRRAIEGSQFAVLHQPVVDVRTGEVVGSEALVRWKHPQRGLIPPDEFISVTEDTGLITEVGRWVLDTAIEDAAAWAREHDLTGFRQSVNVSARQLTLNLSELVAEALERHQWPAERLCLELTESVLMDDLDTTLTALDALKSLGVLLAIDDFGTGYSSLTYLQRLPVDVVKIDQSFVSGLTPTARRAEDDRGTIAKAVIGIAHALGLVAVAEGVENEQQLEVLRRLDCDLAQGYLYSEPVDAAGFSAYLRDRRAGD
jgi:diguanylate cyclase (GGDEF)-like protein/PAS domain S-box-containing protein